MSFWSYNSEFGKRSCYVWAVERPVENRDRHSPTLKYEGQEFHLKLSVCSKTYTLGLSHFPKYTLSVTVHVEDRGRRALPLSYSYDCPAYCRFSNNTYTSLTIWTYKESEILKVIPDFHSNGLLIFLITFDAQVEQKVDPNTAARTVEVELEVVEKSVQTSEYTNAVPCLESLSEDLSMLLDHGPKPDVVLTCGDHKLKAHGIILSNRSKVFAAMLNNDMAESRTGIVEIEDMDQEAFGHFVRYLYTGKLPDLTVDTARRFYEAADKYAVKSLMKRSARFLEENLDLENACEMLVLADAHGDVGLKESVMEYILREEIHLQQDEHWLAFCKSQSMLATEVLNLYCKHQRNK